MLLRTHQCNTTYIRVGIGTDSQQDKCGYDVRSHFAQWNEGVAARVCDIVICMHVYAWVGVLSTCSKFCVKCPVILWMHLCLHRCVVCLSTVLFSVIIIIMSGDWSTCCRVFSVSFLLASIPRRQNPGEKHMWVKVMLILMHSDRCRVFRIIH